MSILVGVQFSAVACLSLMVWTECGKACGAAEIPKPAKVYTDRVRGGK